MTFVSLCGVFVRKMFSPSLLVFTSSSLSCVGEEAGRGATRTRHLLCKNTRTSSYMNNRVHVYTRICWY